jgi:diguanylate cyclase (GGDEF)-like protein/PAS domain S-box-containing protein
MTTPAPSSPSAAVPRLGRVLVVDDEAELMGALCEMLREQGYEVAGYDSARQALAALNERDFDVLLADLMMPDLGGIELLKTGLEIDPHLIGVIMTGQGTVQTAVDAMKSGAFDYVLKPFKLDGVLPVLARAMNVRRLRQENVQLRESVAIYELSQTIAFTLDLNTILNKVADAVLQQCHADELSILLPTPGREELVVAVVRGEGREPLLGRRMAYDSGIAGWVARHRETLTLHGAVADPRFAPVKPRADIHAAVSMPMLVGNKLIGVLNVNSTQQRRPFTLGQVKTLAILANTASAALEAAWLHEQVRQSEERYRQVLENVDEIVYRVDVTGADSFRGKVEFISPRVEHIVGYAAAEFVDDPDLWLRAIHTDDRPAVETQTRELLAGGWGGTREYRMRHKITGEYRWLEDRLTLQCDPAGKAVKIFGVARDITERRQAVDMLARLGRILDTSYNEIYVFDANTLHFVQVNHGAQRNLGYSMEELRHLTPLDLKPEFTRESFDELLAPLRHGAQEILSFEAVHQRKNGSLYPVEVRLQLSHAETPPVFVAIIQDITERKQAQERLSYLAYYDTLTGLPNRTLLGERLMLTMQEADRQERLAAVMFLDLDRFKYINDTLGHDTGDALLKEVAQRLVASVRPGDTIARIGGDEFTVVLANVAHVDDVTRVAQKIMERFTKPIRVAGRELFITPSIGITLYPLDDASVENLIKNADAAMYHAKELGRNTFQFYTAELNVRAARRLALETALRQALARNELLLHYQPQIDLKTGRIIGAEALVRWQNPEFGLIPPAEFIPLAEDTGLIFPIGEWVLRSACTQAAAWHKAGFRPLRVAVNLSGRQLQQRDLHDRVQVILEETGCATHCLDFELTESLLMHDIEDVVAKMKELAAFGIAFSLDDFGTGYSSLSYLKRFPIDALKIDRSFVHDVTTDPDDAAIAKAIIAMAHSLGIRVIAEGVETKPQLDFIRRHGCDAVQGYLFSRPVPAEEFSAFLQAGFEPATTGAKSRRSAARRRETTTPARGRRRKK